MIRKSAYLASSKVLLKESTRLWGRSLTNPTVSERRTSTPPGSFTALVVGSKVAKSLFSTSTPAWVRALSKEDLPLFV